MRIRPLTAVGLACLAAVLLVPIPAARADQVSGGVPGEEKSAAGLKEALRIGAGNAVNLTGKVDGYFRNEAIKILMPKQLQSLEKGLRAVGYGPQVDEFVLSMNRAAERAAPQAKDIFVGAIGQMTFTDARQILTGGETAATDYFKAKTSDELTAAFRPVVEKAMNETGVTRQYKALSPASRRSRPRRASLLTSISTSCPGPWTASSLSWPARSGRSEKTRLRGSRACSGTCSEGDSRPGVARRSGPRSR